MAYGTFRSRTQPLPGGALASGRVSAPLVITTLVLIVVSRLLVAGLSLG